MNNVFYYIFLIFVIMIILLYILTDCNSKINDRQIWPCPHNDRLKYIYIDKPDDNYTSLSLFDIYLTMNDLNNCSKYKYNAFILDTTDIDIGIK